MFKYNCTKRNLYYNKVIALHFEKGYGHSHIAKLIPVSEKTISRWICIFAEENQLRQSMKEKKSSARISGSASSENSEDLLSLRRELKALKEELAAASLRADAYDEMINVAEKQFNISIRKKLAPNGEEPA
ncbi:hypothetical protein [Prevotella ihumii]|uniref:hypothetical protein n=1 Tax=Prevotella ihumii TaxID=1917878 RepID=UPI0009818D4D|nr:hypothetical protein [Prevotella ihumii]